MALIHSQPLNFVLRTCLFPFRKLIPEKFYFAIDGTINVKLTEGKSMLLNGNPTNNLLRVLFWYGFKGFEFKEYFVFTVLIKDSECFFDIGANVGYYSILAKKFNEKVDVHAFEPFPAAKKYLQKNLLLNAISDVHANEIAISEKNGTADFYANRNPRFENIEDHLFGDNSLDKNFSSDFYNKIKITVTTKTLDSYVDEKLLKGQKIDFIKLDTEGSENLVFRGASKTLSTHKPIIMCEVVSGGIEKELEEILLAHNYTFYQIQNGKLKLVPNLRVHEGKEDYFLVESTQTHRIKQLI